MELTNLGTTGIQVSPLGLGTVKFGRNQQVKYPQPFTLPSDTQLRDLLDLASDLGINLIDTAPAYGTSMQRLGQLLPKTRERWVIVSKVGESFHAGQSQFDFGYQATIESVHTSLRTLNTDYLDVVLIHSNGDDLHILNYEPVVTALEQLKMQGVIRAHGISSKTVAGGLQAITMLDVVMVTLNPLHQEELAVVTAAAKLNKGVLIKKGLQSGYINDPATIQAALQFIFSQSAVNSLIIGTINPEHLRSNAVILDTVLSTARSN
ncbi:aldo/keto reductase [Achromatium sp. WMS2]|nr:aldo/keto reductase [Achromatium sp. WMS2]